MAQPSAPAQPSAAPVSGTSALVERIRLHSDTLCQHLQEGRFGTAVDELNRLEDALEESRAAIERILLPMSQRWTRYPQGNDYSLFMLGLFVGMVIVGLIAWLM